MALKMTLRHYGDNSADSPADLAVDKYLDSAVFRSTLSGVVGRHGFGVCVAKHADPLVFYVCVAEKIVCDCCSPCCRKIPVRVKTIAEGDRHVVGVPGYRDFSAGARDGLADRLQGREKGGLKIGVARPERSLR
jgi:hypothetical protein